MAIIVAKLTPKQGGKEFELPQVIDYDWEIRRIAGPNGHIALRGFDIGIVSITRYRSLQENGEAKREDESIKLAAGINQKAYCSGQITAAPPDDDSNVLQTVRWDTGFISKIRSVVTNSGITEHIELTVSDLKVDDSEFLRVAA